MRDDAAAMQASLDRLIAFNRASTKSHSGIWRDLAVGKRATGLDSQIGLVADMGQAAGVPTPLLRALQGLIHDIEQGRREQSLETFQQLALTCPPPTTSVAA